MKTNLCGKYLGDNYGTCPQLTCVRKRGHEGLCDNVRGDETNLGGTMAKELTPAALEKLVERLRYDFEKRNPQWKLLGETADALVALAKERDKARLDTRNAMRIRKAEGEQYGEEISNLLAQVARLERENAELRAHIDRRAIGNDPLANTLRARARELEALVGTVREMVGCQVRNVDDIGVEQHSREIGAQLAALRPAAEALGALAAWLTMLRSDRIVELVPCSEGVYVELTESIGDRLCGEARGPDLAAAIRAALDKARATS